ncbi:hypothetical protein ACFE04_003692 [Oxalis oulophora]
MSWLARSIANSLKFDDDDENATEPDPNNPNPNSEPNSELNQNPQSGVREDLNDFTKTLTRQIWGVASFLAPPAPQTTDHVDQSKERENESDDDVEEEEEEEEGGGEGEEVIIAGIKSDFAEISGKFKTGISKLSTNINVSEITKIASNFLQFGSEDDDGVDLVNAVGVNEDVLTFARNLVLHPGTWLDFPIPDDDNDQQDDFYDFDMTDAQQEHALAVEHFVPQLAALRIELCPEHMSEGCFWKIYFVLLHPRLNEENSKLLSTPQIVEARALFMHELQTQDRANPDQIHPGNVSAPDENSGLSHEKPVKTPDAKSPESGIPVEIEKPVQNPDAKESVIPVEIETEKHPIQTTEVQVIDKAVVKEEPLNQTNKPSASKYAYEQSEDDDTDDWLKEETSETVGVSGPTSITGANDEDVSFSDLEDDDDENVPIIHTKTTSGSDSSTKDSRDWVQLSRSSTDSGKDDIEEV